MALSRNEKSTNLSSTIQQRIWAATLMLEISLHSSESRSYDEAATYLIAYPRLAYLPFLLHNLLDYFAEDLIADIDTISADRGRFLYDGVPLKWHLPVGLLHDLYVGSTSIANPDIKEDSVGSYSSMEPFRLSVQFSCPDNEPSSLQPNQSEKLIHDMFVNSVKEADFMRSGTAKPIMSLSAEDSKTLWAAAQSTDLVSFVKIHNILLPKTGSMRNIPMRVYLPSDSGYNGDDRTDQATSSSSIKQQKGHIKVIQGQIASLVAAGGPATASQLRGMMGHTGQSQTVGTALHSLLPSLFPSRRTTILAKPMLHGAVLPMSAALDELATTACYADGWLNIVVAMTA